ncbi:hypothetical protein [Spirochaeta africana]|uniref:Uncharacterized protein n=1 Tax=Spirochaeta africana (strain ATCC 700263 / DSM 8902 / Z-7692) TaxID=889378 RepID=H9UJ37_SPIAZ|nr:hypothetical protein [Spirochaeta africana]AFG37530.1 hypothetical protein Spiaf_1468 [Spirochaeta africana DSM 8902]
MAITHYLTATPIDPPVRSPAGSSGPTVGYYGTARMHPYDARKIILVPYPYHPDEGVYEFYREDIRAAENSSEVANEDGDIITVMWLQIRSGAHAVNLKSFTVGR